MAVINYEDYARPLAPASRFAFGQVEEQSWIRRNWTTVMRVLGYALLIGSDIARQVVNTAIPPGVIQPSDFETIVISLQKLNPTLSREEITAKLCAILGNRAPLPYCAGGLPTVAPGMQPAGIAGIPSWAILLGVGALLLFWKR